MFKTNLFRQHYVITAAILVSFIFLGIMTHFLVMRMMAPSMPINPPVFMAKFIELINNTGGYHDRVQALQKMESLHDREGSPPLSFMLLDENGIVLYPKGQALPFRWDSIPHPSSSYATQTVHLSKKSDPGFGPGVPGGPPGPGQYLIRFEGAPVQFLFVNFGEHRPPPFMGIVASLGSLILSVLLGAGVALLALFRSLQKKAQLADSVIAELQRGNLKARFPIKRLDEVGQAMTRFNLMAEEIEKLVEQVRTAEKSRMSLLQELAHDLRTPIASLKNLMETLQTKEKNLEPKVKEELFALALSEVEYFERLVEDLLVLAQVSEPNYRADQKSVQINELFDDEAETIAAQHQTATKKITLKKSMPAQDLYVLGDVHLLRRLFRNALTNAFAFAKSEVDVSIELTGQSQVCIVITDDGPGMSAEALSSFGIRRQSRMLQETKTGRVSVGLGSVIMKTVAEIHRGTITPGNKLDEQGKALGATVEIRLQIQTTS